MEQCGVAVIDWEKVEKFFPNYKNITLCLEEDAPDISLFKSFPDAYELAAAKAKTSQIAKEVGEQIAENINFK